MCSLFAFKIGQRTYIWVERFSVAWMRFCSSNSSTTNWSLCEWSHTYDILSENIGRDETLIFVQQNLNNAIVPAAIHLSCLVLSSVHLVNGSFCCISFGRSRRSSEMSREEEEAVEMFQKANEHGETKEKHVGVAGIIIFTHFATSPKMPFATRMLVKR